MGRLLVASVALLMILGLIVDGGATHVGLESTVVDLSAQTPTILRPGAISAEILRELLPELRIQRAITSSTDAMPAPGMLAKHYSPRTPVVLHAGERSGALRALQRDAQHRLDRGERVVVLAYAGDVKELVALPVQLVELGNEADPEAVAARLYAALREGDELGAAAILVRSMNTEHPLSAAIHDRLRRAAAR